MTKETMIFRLVRKAEKTGGDRYEVGNKGEPNHMVIYIPQRISRANGEIRTEVTVTFE